MVAPSPTVLVRRYCRSATRQTVMHGIVIGDWVLSSLGDPRTLACDLGSVGSVAVAMEQVGPPAVRARGPRAARTRDARRPQRDGERAGAAGPSRPQPPAPGGGPPPVGLSAGSGTYH